MPGNLTTTAPVGVLPKMTFMSFVESRVFPMQETNYHDGGTERSVIVDGVNPAASIKAWKLAARLLPDQLTALKTFYETTTAGALKPFYFYSPMEPQSGHAVGSNWDGSGTAIYGRYKVKFSSQAFLHEAGIARFNVSFELTETA